jgi:hypothetical protein
MPRFVVMLLLAAGCSGTAPAARDGAPDSGAGVCDPYAQSNAPNAPCAKDEDCHDPFLVCVRSMVSICRTGGTPAPVDTGCPPPYLADVPVCPAIAEVALSTCNVRYQLGCASDHDCGPVGFVCRNGMCDGSGHEVVCAAKVDCPTGWDCYDPCPCTGAPSTAKRCYPPFAAFGCPACAPVSDPSDAAVTAD